MQDLKEIEGSMFFTQVSTAVIVSPFNFRFLSLLGHLGKIFGSLDA